MNSINLNRLLLTYLFCLVGRHTTRVLFVSADCSSAAFAAVIEPRIPLSRFVAPGLLRAWLSRSLLFFGLFPIGASCRVSPFFAKVSRISRLRAGEFSRSHSTVGLTHGLANVKVGRQSDFELPYHVRLTLLSCSRLVRSPPGKNRRKSFGIFPVILVPGLPDNGRLRHTLYGRIIFAQTYITRPRRLIWIKFK